MKVTVLSDLHLEFAPNFRPQNPGSDILILSGDICVATYLHKTPQSKYYLAGQQFVPFFEHCAKNWAHVIYVMGNHEHYDGKYNDTANILRSALQHLPNVHLLDNEVFELGDYLFIGATLWTDVNRDDPLTHATLTREMNDYRLVKYRSPGGTWSRLYPAITMRDHHYSKGWIFGMAAANPNRKLIVSTHHAPSPKSIHPLYDEDYYLNGGYYSNLEEDILKKPNIVLWTHGHMHNNFDYMVGSTNVVCNPKGYNNENPAFDPSLIKEI